MSEKFLQMNITFYIKTGQFKIEGSVKKVIQSDLIAGFLYTQIGQGKDNSQVNTQDIYHISLKWYPHNDHFEVNDDINNKGALFGILSTIASKLDIKE